LKRPARIFSSSVFASFSSCLRRCFKPFSSALTNCFSWFAKSFCWRLRALSADLTSSFALLFAALNSALAARRDLRNFFRMLMDYFRSFLLFIKCSIYCIQHYLDGWVKLMRVEKQVRASDLVGCRYRLVQRRNHPEAPRTDAAQARAERYDAAREAVWANFPRKSDSRRTPFRRIDLGPLPAPDPWLRSLETLEALATGATHITGAVFANEQWIVGVDMLVRAGASTSDVAYTPVMVSSHRVARKHDKATTPGVPTHRLGLSKPLELGYKARHHVLDGYHLAMAARALDDLGLNSGRGGLVGQDRNLTFFSDTASYQDALDKALEAVELHNLPTQPRRVKECASCRFWPLCQPELEAMDDISLFLRGDRARPYRERGIDTVQGLIDASLGLPSQLVAAWRDGTVLLARGDVTVPRADVEIDLDMEAYLDQGAYLWGAWLDGTYYDFVTWEALGSKAEAH